MDIKKKVEHLTRRFGTRDPFQIAEALGIQLVYSDLGETWGCSSTYKRIKFIHINENLDERWQRYTCAHELGHSVLHRGVSLPYLKQNTFFSPGTYERQADTFAAELLLPDSLIQENPGHSIYDLAESVGLPPALITLKR